MILMDTDHVTVLRMPRSSRRDALVARLDAVVGETVGIAIVTVEEQMRGWLAAIAKERKPVRRVAPYRELAALFGFFADFEIVPFDEAAVTAFETLGSVQIGTMDKKIAAIAVAQ